MQVELLYLLIGNTAESSEAIGVFSNPVEARDHVDSFPHDNPFRSFTVRRLILDRPEDELTQYGYEKSDSGTGWVRNG